MPSNASRYLFLFIAGLVVGTILTVVSMRALQARQDPFPGSVMHVMAKQTDLLKQRVTQNRCSTSDALPRLQSLRAMGNDLETAFPDLADDSRFSAHASKLRGTLDTAIAAAPGTCGDIEATTRKIGETCQACHQDFAG